MLEQYKRMGGAVEYYVLFKHKFDNYHSLNDGIYDMFRVTERSKIL